MPTKEKVASREKSRLVENGLKGRRILIIEDVIMANMTNTTCFHFDFNREESCCGKYIYFIIIIFVLPFFLCDLGLKMVGVPNS